MITYLNDKSTEELWSKYTILFNKVWADLKDHDLIPEEGPESKLETFQNLEHYFAHMGDIAKLGDPTYLLIPIDEKPFEIDANSRSITVPSEFAKCGAVRTDKLCEIATFRIARYYDFQDLADCQIGIQWVNADGQEGLSMAFGKDVESEPGYIRFGWAITDAVTAKAGSVKLAVRFFRKDEDKSAISYILNTLPTSITVKDTLSVDESAEGFIKEENVIDLFKGVVINGQNPMYAKPATPIFAPDNGGINFEENAQRAIDPVTDSLDLPVMAVTKDNSYIEYEWFYEPSDVEEKVTINLSKNIEDLTSIGHNTKAYEIEEENFVLAENLPTVKDLAKYYTYDSDSDTYSLFNEKWDAEQLEGKLYIKRSLLKILPGDYLVTGEYYATATSSLIEADEKFKNPNTEDATSNSVSILPPNKIKVTEDLPEHVFKGTDLKVVIKEDPRNPKVTYEWERKATKEGNFEKVESASEAGISTDEVGWYKASVKSKLNRTTESATSSICFVSNEAITPVISKYEYSKDKGESWIELQENDIIDLGTGGAGKHEIWVKVAVDKDQLNEFNSDVDSLSYSWRIAYGDKGTIENVTEDTIKKNEIVLNTTDYNTDTLKVFQTQDNEVFSLYCTITNTFQGQTKSIDTYELNRPFSIK